MVFLNKNDTLIVFVNYFLNGSLILINLRFLCFFFKEFSKIGYLVSCNALTVFFFAIF